MAQSSEVVIEVVPGTGQPVPRTEESKNKEPAKRSVWWRWLLIIIAAPLLLILTLLGIFVWIVLIPFKIFCWPVGFLAQMLWNVVEYLIKAPFRAMQWAAGEPWRPAPAPNPQP